MIKILFKQKQRLIESIIKNYDIYIICVFMIFPFELIMIYILVSILKIKLGLLLEKITPICLLWFQASKKQVIQKI